ncbi:MAG TPA: alpha/beta fold hydrolase, partial [Thermoanaerobaculia bacterium]|nr:alpha/beta fold hydrolase [Thermoanaerobaculia bacterium]
FHSVESADDLDDLRHALGAEKISLLGFSYGTHLAAAAMRRHGERLHRVVLVGVEGPDHTRKLPSSLDTQMRRLSLLAAGDPRVGTAFPDTYGTLKRLLSRLEEQPVTVSIPDPQGRPVEVPVGREGLQLILTMDAGDGNDFPVFPALVYGLDQGDAGILAWFVRKRIAGFSRGVLATFYAVDGASGASPERWLRIEREARDAILGNVANAVFPEVNAALGIPDLGEGLRAPLHSTVPTLLISGELDSNAPPYQAEELRWGLTDGTHLVVAHAGHEGMLGREDVGIVIRDFLRGDDVRDRHLALPPVRFLSLAEAKEQRALRR